MASGYGAPPQYGAPPPYGTPYGKATPSGASLIAAGLQTGGRVLAVWRAIGGVIIMLVLVMIGSIILQDKHTASAPMTITSVLGCTQQPDGSYSCVASVTFNTPDGKTYTPPQLRLTNQPTPLLVGAILNLGYNPKNPNDVNPGAPPPKAFGWLLIAGGVAVGGVAIGLAVLSFKSKTYAAIEGVNGIYNLARGRYGGADDDEVTFYGGDPADPPSTSAALVPLQKLVNIADASKNNKIKSTDAIKWGIQNLAHLNDILKMVQGAEPWIAEFKKCIKAKDWTHLLVLAQKCIEIIQQQQMTAQS